jgi:8-amino-7-oxononanoate synthase
LATKSRSGVQALGKVNALSADEKRRLLKSLIEAKGGAKPSVAAAGGEPSEAHWRFELFDSYRQIVTHRAIGRRLEIDVPFFAMHEEVDGPLSVVDGRSAVTFSTYDYLGLNKDPRVAAAAKDAIDRWGMSASASRVVAGERPPHRILERAIAAMLGTEDAVAFVSGHATNVNAIATLLGPKDVVLHDRLIHNSVLQGALLSKATRIGFAHQDYQGADDWLAQNRHNYEKVLIVVEGIYSMDGDICPLDRFVEVKRRHGALLMVDEAHSIGALGARGRGIGEHFGIAGPDVDIWMGTLSKTLCSCGGYVAGSAALVEVLKYMAPGFVYSVGMPPPVAAAAAAALDCMLAEPERVRALRANAELFLGLAREAGLDTGLAQGVNIVPIVVRNSVIAAKLSNALMEAGINASPIIYPAVDERSARLRFFLSAAHTRDQIVRAVEVTARELKRLRSMVGSDEGDAA